VLDFLDRNWSYARLSLTALGGGFLLLRVLFGDQPDRIGGFAVAIGSLAPKSSLGQVLIWSTPSPIFALVGVFLTGLGVRWFRLHPVKIGRKRHAVRTRIEACTEV
jgi:hypothetical protein